jgi:hypothetical protein
MTCAVWSCAGVRCAWSVRSAPSYQTEFAAITAVAEKLGIGTAETPMAGV